MTTSNSKIDKKKQKQTPKYKRDRLIVFGYIRDSVTQQHSQTDSKSNNNMNIHLLPPIDVIELCLRYYFIFDLLEYAYDMIEQWDAWDPNAVNDVMYIEAGDVLCRRSEGGSNPYSFGTQVIDAGVSLWRFEVIRPLVYWVGVFPDSVSGTSPHMQQTSNCQRMDHHYLVSAEMGTVQCSGARVNLEYNQFSTLKYGRNVGHTFCMCLDFSESRIRKSDSDSDSTTNNNNTHSTSAGSAATAATAGSAGSTTENSVTMGTLSFSMGNSEFIPVSTTVPVSDARKFRMCMSMPANSKVKLVASTHIR